MAAEIGDVVVRVGGDVTSLKQGMAAGASSVGAFSAKATKQLREVASQAALVGTAAIAAGAGIVAGIINNGRQAIDAQAKLAQALGGTIGGLRALEMAAGDAGMSEEELAGAMARMNARLGEAQRGTGAAYEALDRLGLSADVLSQMDLDDRMAAIADRMKELGLSSSVAQSELRDLGIRNENLATMMRQGGDAIREQANEVKNLGLNLSMVDAAQVELANDALGVFGDVLTGVQDRLTVAAAPYITEISERFREAALESSGFKNEIDGTIESAIRGFAKVADGIHGVRVAIKGAELIGVGFGAAIVSSAQVALEAFAKVDEGVTWVSNKVIDALNLVFDSDIAKIDPFTDSPFMLGLREMGEAARNKVGLVRTELHELAMQELPSTQVEKFLADVAARAKETAAEVVGARSAMTSTSGDYFADEKGGAGKGAGDQGSKDQAIERELQSLRDKFKTESELLIEQQLYEQELLAAALETKRITMEEYRTLEQQSLTAHQEALTAIEQQAADARLQVAQAEAAAKRQAIGNALSDLSTLMNTESRKMFEVGKAAAIAQTGISTIESAQKSSNALAGIPIVGPALGAAAAAAAIAGGMARVSAIRSQSFGGGGAGAVATGSNTAAVNAASTPVGGAPQQDRVMRVEGVDSGSLFSGNQLRGLVEAIDEFRADGGGRVVFA